MRSGFVTVVVALAMSGLAACGGEAPDRAAIRARTEAQAELSQLTSAPEAKAELDASAGVQSALKELHLSAPDLNRSTRLKEDLKADELDMVELVMALEERFGIEIEDAEFARLKTFGDVVDLVARKTADRSSKP